MQHGPDIDESVHLQPAGDAEGRRPVTPPVHSGRLPRRRAMQAGVAALLVAVVGLLAWSASTENLGPSAADEGTSGADRKSSPVAKHPQWSSVGSLASDGDFIADAVAELDVEERPVLLWAGEAQHSTLDLTEFAVFAISVPAAVPDLFEFRTVGRGDDGWETVEGGVDEDGVGPRVGSFANTIVGLPFSEIEGHKTPDSPQDILLTREDVSAVSVLPDDPQTIRDRTVVTRVDDDEESSRGRYAVSAPADTGYTSTDIHRPLPREGWDRDVAERVLREISPESGHLVTVGRPGPVTLDDGTATVAAVAEHQVSELREGEPDATSWQAVVDLPDERFKSVDFRTMMVSSTASLGDPDALSAGAPYALPVDKELLSGSALVVTQGVQVRTLSGPSDEKYRDLTTAARTATIEPELPALGPSTDRASAQILEFDEPSAAVIWANDDGDPIWSSVVKQASDS